MKFFWQIDHSIWLENLLVLFLTKHIWFEMKTSLIFKLCINWISNSIYVLSLHSIIIKSVIFKCFNFWFFTRTMSSCEIQNLFINLMSLKMWILLIFRIIIQQNVYVLLIMSWKTLYEMMLLQQQWLMLIFKIFDNIVWFIIFWCWAFFLKIENTLMKVFSHQCVLLWHVILMRMKNSFLLS